MSFCRRHDDELKDKLLDKIFPNDSEKCNNWIGNGNSGMDAVAQANPNAYTKLKLSNGHRKHFEKRLLKVEHSTNLLYGMVESGQLTTGILYAKIVIDEFADEISLMETQLVSSKAQTTTSSENGPVIGPAVSWEEMMMQLQFFGIWNKEEIRQLEVNDLVWIVDENVTRRERLKSAPYLRLKKLSFLNMPRMFSWKALKTLSRHPKCAFHVRYDWKITFLDWKQRNFWKFFWNFFLKKIFLKKTSKTSHSAEKWKGGPFGIL